MNKSILWVLLWAASFNAHADFNARVIKVADGDTVTVLRGTEQVRVRLSSIDAPEKKQAFGSRSQQHLSGLVFDKTVRVVEDGTDRYGRTIGVLHVDGININRRMVSDGMAWAYTAYLNDQWMWVLELRARFTQAGLWNDAHPLPPWQFRREQAAARRAKRDNE